MAALANAFLNKVMKENSAQEMRAISCNVVRVGVRKSSRPFY
jgi:hypothetical protein